MASKLKKALPLKPDFVDAQVALAEKAVAALPNAHEIRYHLAQAWLKAGDKAKARSELERLLAGDAKFPQQAEAMNLLKQLKN